MTMTEVQNNLICGCARVWSIWISRFEFVSHFGFRISCLGLLLAFVPLTSRADEGTAFFEKKIRPVLAAKCYSCHSAEAVKKRNLKGELQLDTRAGIRAGGESGPAVVPGKVDESLIIESIRRESFEMPPDETLPDETIADFVRWIEMGAPDPRDGQPVEASGEIDYAEERKHWAYQPLKFDRPKVNDENWPAGDVDRFVLAKMEETDVKPAADASPVTMLRRLSFDLTGLPPTLEQVKRFEALLPGEAPATYEALVDELLASPQFGEQWARHWLDGIRFEPNMETSAFYRNWVIKALNDDLPYNEFLRWQLAGDLILHKNSEAAADAVVATQMIAYNRNEDDFVEASLEVLGQQIFGISLNCAKCHDHKYDAVSQEDYYALAGILDSSDVPKSARDGVKIPGTDTQVITISDQEPKRIGHAYLLIGGDRSRRGEMIPRRLPKVFFGNDPPRLKAKSKVGVWNLRTGWGIPTTCSPPG